MHSSIGGGGMVRSLAVLALAIGLVACGSPAPSSPPATASVAHDPFRLDLTVDRTTWRAGDLITGSAMLTNTGTAAATLYGSSMGPVTFVFREVGGTRVTGNVMTADCGGRDLAAGAATTAQLHASEATSSSDDPWIAAANDEHGAKLPAGTWDIAAEADFFTGGDMCFGTEVRLIATARVTVLP
jgi:hypothetical protein